MIEQLPLHIANQIAAGEVVQRGSSIIKELIENSIDAGASRISVRVEDGGRTLIQIVDDGCGMSVEDASRAFLRHATSKIRTTEDLFNLRTFGFRGEALASISSVAEVELITRKAEDELATRVVVRDGMEVEKGVCGANVGTTITVRNLFYSIPARRKFLKSDAYETKLCRTEFYRVAMVHPEVAFEYADSSNPPLILAPQNRMSRIVSLTKPSYAKKLLPLSVDSPLVQVSGYVGTPDMAKAKSRVEQYMFVNGRFFRNLRIFKSICDVYSRLIAPTNAPSLFLYIDVDPNTIDVNVNPTKTEVKFEDEDSIVQIIASAVKLTLGKNNIVPSIDFEQSDIEIPSYSPQREFSHTAGAPTAYSPTRQNYNPFENSGWGGDGGESIPEGFDEQKAPFDENYMMDCLRGEGGSGLGVEHSDGGVSQMFAMMGDVGVLYPAVQFGGNRYLGFDSVDGLVVVNVARARCRIEFEELLSRGQDGDVSSQALLVPYEVELSVEQKAEVMENREKYLGFGVEVEDNGGMEVVVRSMPVGFDIGDVEELLCGNSDSELDYDQRIAQMLTNHILMQSPRKLNTQEISSLFERLMNCSEPNYTPTGLKVIEVVGSDEIEKRFKR